MRSAWMVLVLSAGLLAAQTAAPRLALDANGSTALTLYRGWPLFLHGLLTHSLRAQAGEVPPLLLAPPEGSWADRVSMVIFTSGGPVSWPLERWGRPETDVLTVPKKGRVSMTWWLESARTAELEPGVYALAVLIEVSDSKGWNGRAPSVPVVITVENAPAELTPVQRETLALLQAREAMAKGEPKRAAGILIEQMERSPGSVAVAAGAAAYLEEAGSIEMAFAFAEAALHNFNTAAQPSVLPPAELVELRNRLARRVFSPLP